MKLVRIRAFTLGIILRFKGFILDIGGKCFSKDYLEYDHEQQNNIEVIN